MVVAHNGYKFVTVFASKTVLVSEVKPPPGSRSGFKALDFIETLHA
jgi:hypothetical protein